MLNKANKIHLHLIAICVLMWGIGGSTWGSPIAGVTIDSKSSENPTVNRLASYLVDGSGLNAGGPGTHTSSASGTMWLNSDASYSQVSSQWIIFNLGATYNLQSSHIWNYNEVCSFGTGYEPFWAQRRGVYQMDVQVSVDKATWTDLGVKTLTAATGLDTYLGQDVALSATGVHYIKFNILSNQCSSGIWTCPGTPPNPSTDGYVGLSEVQFNKAVPAIASTPYPIDGGTGIPFDTVLSWLPANQAIMHDVYIGTGYNDVNNANASSAGIYRGCQYAVSYYPHDLEYNATYYWRIDEVNLSNPISPWKGTVWSFATNNNVSAYEVPGVTIQAVSSELEDGARPAVHVVDGSGLNINGPGTHRNFPWGNMWLSRTGQSISSQYLIFALNGTYDLTGVRIWNYNEAPYYYTGRGVNSMQVLVSSNNLTYVSLGNFNLTKAPGTENVDFSQKIPLTANGVRYVKFVINSNFDSSDGYVGLSEVRFIANVAYAEVPTPNNGAKDVPVNVRLGWSPGRYAGTHDVYFGDNLAEVQMATNSAVPPGQGRRTVNSFNPGILALDTTYYWRVDEYNDTLVPHLWKGDVWSFKVTDHVTVDNFDSYGETMSLKDKWQDSSNQVPVTGSQILLEKGLFASDKWMRFNYNNSSAPFYSEICRKIDSWEWPIAVADCAKVLTIWFKGSLNNVAEQMYVGLCDDSNNTYIKVLTDKQGVPDVDIIKSEYWSELNLNLDQFIGVNPGTIRKIFIGVGNRQVPTTGHTGTIYLDDVRLRNRLCFDRPAGDICQDCEINFRDFAQFANNWLLDKSSIADLTGDSKVDLNDLSVIANNWLTKASLQRMTPPKSWVNYKPLEGRLGDVIPFYWNGEYHVFYLRAVDTSMLGIPWEHIKSKDLVHWEEMPTAISPGASNEPDGGSVFTGSVIEHNGTFHAFYTGYNPWDARPWNQEQIMHATSSDLITWTKHPQDTFGPDGIHYLAEYNSAAFRDAYVFWNENEQVWWMLLCAQDAVTKAQVLGLATSNDLTHWTQVAPLITNIGVYAAECPDLFKIGSTYYLTFPAGGTTARYATNPRGPWLDCSTGYIDPYLCASKRQFDGQRHILTGNFPAWLPEQTEGPDGVANVWGGAQCLAREVYQGPSPGQLYVKPAAEVVAAFTNTVFDLATNPNPDIVNGNWYYTNSTLIGEPAGASGHCTFNAPGDYMLECQFQLIDPQAIFKIEVREQENTGAGYDITLNPATDELGILVPDTNGYNGSRSCPMDGTKKIKVQVFVLGTIIECFVNDAYALSTRANSLNKGKLGLTVTQGRAQITYLLIKTQD